MNLEEPIVLATQEVIDFFVQVPDFKFGFEIDLVIVLRAQVNRIAEFSGSWKFLISFGAVIFVWIGAYIVLLATKPFDPYPFILLNLILSCLAAVQAPVIMMS